MGFLLMWIGWTLVMNRIEGAIQVTFFALLVAGVFFLPASIKLDEREEQTKRTAAAAEARAKATALEHEIPQTRSRVEGDLARLEGLVRTSSWEEAGRVLRRINVTLAPYAEFGLQNSAELKPVIERLEALRRTAQPHFDELQRRADEQRLLGTPAERAAAVNASARQQRQQVAAGEQLTVTSSSPPEAKLAAIDAGRTIVQQDAVSQYAHLLDGLERKCQENRVQISDITAKGVELLAKKNVPMTHLKFLQSMDGSMPPGTRESLGRLSCAEISAFLVTGIDRP